MEHTIIKRIYFVAFISLLMIQFGVAQVKSEVDADSFNTVEGLPRKIHKRRLSNIIEKIKTKIVNDCEEMNWYSQMDMDYQISTPCRNLLILTDRNNKWMKQIKYLIEEQNCFIAVGLSHLMYECGLINQLTELGYTITPVEVK